MTGRCILHTHISKLGHPLEEIRERALFNIISKLDHGFLYDNDLARSKELLTKLFSWFGFEEISHTEKVLTLIKRIIQSESGGIIVNHIGIENVLKDVEEIRNKIHTKYHYLIDEIIDTIKPAQDSRVPPLFSNVPLSYRSDESDDKHNKFVGSTATPIVGQIYERTLGDNAGGNNLFTKNLIKSNSKTCFQNYKIFLPHMLLPWQPLVTPDLHVLESVEESMNNSSVLANLMNTCEFFSDVMLQDYPAEIFIQRPNILNLFFTLLINSNISKHQMSLLNCLEKFTLALIARIKFYNDPCTHNLKQHKCTIYTLEAGTLNNPPNSYRSKYSDTNFSIINEICEDSATLKLKQLTLPNYCLKLLINLLQFISKRSESIKTSNKKRSKQGILNVALNTIDQGFILLCTCIHSSIFGNHEDTVLSSISEKLYTLFSTLGEVLEYFRLSVATTEQNYSERSVHLRLLHTVKNTLNQLVPKTKADLILPMVFKKALASTLLDVPLYLLYADVHETILEYVETFSGQGEMEFFSKYKNVKEVNNSMSKAIKFLKQSSALTIAESLDLANGALRSLDFHKNLIFVKLYVDMCANKLPLCDSNEQLWNIIDEITLSLLGHSDYDIQAEMYKLCHKRIQNVMGPKFNAAASNNTKQINFLIRPGIIIELAAHGMNNKNIQIQTHSEEMLILVLKSKLLVSKEMWRNVLGAILPTLPLIICHAGKSTPLGRVIIGILDPDSATSMDIPQIEILKGNLLLLFSKDELAREESLSRLCWLLAVEPNAHEYMPRLSTLQNDAINVMCIQQPPINLNQMKPQHYYQPSSLIQVLELLRAQNVEPAIRRSALTQISVMCEDSLLHCTFLDNGGLNLALKILRSALKETDYRNYPDSIISTVSILKNICLFNPLVRQEIALNKDLFYCVLRGLMLFCAETRMKEDASILLCLLLYSNYTIGTPLQGGISLPHVIVKTMNIPFVSQVHWKTSRFVKPGLKGILLGDQFCKSAIRLYFNTELFGGYKRVIDFDLQNENTDWNIYNEDLKLSRNDLKALQSSCIYFCCKSYLMDIENATSHGSVIECFDKLTSCLHLYNLMQIKNGSDILSLPWESVLNRFFCVPPAGESDLTLLNRVLNFLRHLVVLYEDMSNCWIVKSLKQPSHSVYVILKEDGNLPQMKAICQNLLLLITKCHSLEQQSIDFKTFHRENTENWNHVVKTIDKVLENNETEYFYNLAYLDSLLSCMVNVTASLGWSNSKPNSPPQKPLPQLVLRLCELVNAFHCGKGPSASTSLMGLSITRNSLLIMNHILAEMHYCNTKKWELCWFDFESDNCGLANLCTLWLSRDVILRAAILQLLAGIATSLSGASKLVEINLAGKSGIWEAALTILTDHGEASIVREQAANLLANLLSHNCCHGGGGDVSQPILHTSLLPLSLQEAVQAKHSPVDLVLLLLEDYNFFKEVVTMFWCLFTEHSTNLVMQFNTNDIEFKVLEEQAPVLPTRNEYNLKYTKSGEDITSVRSIASSSDRSSENEDGLVVVTTPGLIKHVTKLLINLLNLAPEKIAKLLQEYNIIKELFRCLCTPNFTELKNSRSISLYCDILEMSEYICELLNQSAHVNATCLATLLNSKDCLNVLFAIINTNIYYEHLQHLLYLRNRLWSEAFSLLGTLVGCSTNATDAFSLINVIIKDCNQEQFLQTVCEAISSSYSTDLQHSALSSLTSILRLEYASSEISSVELFSMQNLLDTTKTPRSCSSLDTKRDNLENLDPNVKPSPQLKNNNLKRIEIMKKACFEEKLSAKQYNKRNIVQSPKENEDLMVGAEICKILIHLYTLCDIEDNNDCQKKKQLVVNTLTCILCISNEAKNYAYRNGFVTFLTNNLKEIHIKLTLEPADALRRVSDRKRVCPLLKDANCLMGLLTNFMLGNEDVKEEAAKLGIADLVHKFWIWCCLQKPLLEDALKMLCTFTTNCLPACHSLTLTSSVAGSGPRKSPSNSTLIHAVINLIMKEMELISRTHSLDVIKLCFHLLHNCCCSIEIRVILLKSNIFSCLTRLHPTITKRQKPWEQIEMLWLEFLQTYTGYIEGQIAIAKANEALEIIFTLTNSPKVTVRYASMIVVRNVAFYNGNRSRLLASDEFLNVLHNKLSIGNNEEKKLCVLTIWSIIANNQKSKIILKSAGIDARLQELVRQYELKSYEGIELKDANIINYVCALFTDNDKSR